MTIIIEQWLSDYDAQLAGGEFPEWTDSRWHTFTGEREYGKQEGAATIAGPYVARIHDDLASGSFVRALEDALGFDDRELIVDRDRTGGGIHQCAPGGRLALHTDFNVHPQNSRLVRAVNVIVFVSEWGIGAAEPGALVMRVNGTDIRIAPAPGLLVAWRAEDDIYHGHPEPMRDDQPTRRSIPAYYYRTLRPDEYVVPHSTRFLE